MNWDNMAVRSQEEAVSAAGDNVDEALRMRTRMKEAIDSAEEFKSALSRMIDGMSVTEYKVYEMRIEENIRLRDRA